MLPVRNHPFRPIEHLYRLTVLLKGSQVDVYALATSVDSAYDRYLDRARNRQEDTVGLQLIHGELANPHAS